MILKSAPGRLPPGIRVYAVGDVHGCANRLRAMQDAIEADIRVRPVDDTLIVHLGDCIDRGPDSAGVVAILSEAGAVPTICLMGNHERTMLDALDGDRAAATDWRLGGGAATLASWGAPVDAPVAEWCRAIPAADRAWLAARPLSHRVGDYLFVHAGIRPGVELDRQEPRDLITIRQIFLTSERDFGAVIVHGHTVKPEPVVRRNRIGIDTGAVFGGKLTCAVLEADRLGFLTVD